MKPATAWPPVPPTYSIEKVLKRGEEGGERQGKEDGGKPVTAPERGDLWSHTEWVLDSWRGGWKSGLRLSGLLFADSSHIWTEMIRWDYEIIINS